jgi:UDP-N-acetylglucosamine:LPS N-acetylglucosamine transferase
MHSMDLAYAAVDLIMSKAGAMTWETFYSGKEASFFISFLYIYIYIYYI